MAKCIKKIIICFIMAFFMIGIVSCGVNNPSENPELTECEKGNHTYVDGVCSECGEKDPSTGPTECEKGNHTYVDGVCSECGEKQPGEPSIKDNYDCISIAEAIELAKAAGESGTTEKYYVYGKVKKVSDSVYGEMTIEDETGELYVYGVVSSDGNTRYDAMEERPIAGDEVVLLGMLKTYNSSPEMDRGYLQEFKHNKVEIDDKDYTVYSVGAARELAAGEKVKLTGVVAQLTYAFGQVPNGFYLVDNSGSIYVYGSEVTGQVRVGNTVTIIGEKTYYISEKEASNAEKHGYKGCCQIQNAQILENDKLVNDFDKTWISTSTVKEIIETDVSENITTNIYKVNAYVKKVEAPGFVNYYINDLDGNTGSYVYTACSGADFAWLDEFDGKICTVYLSPINCKSNASGCIYRFIPVLVQDEGFVFDVNNAAEFAIEYFAVNQFLSNYESDPSVELITSVNCEELGFTNVQLSYETSDNNIVSFEVVDNKVVFHTNNSGNAIITISAELVNAEGAVISTSSRQLNVIVSTPVTYEHITVSDAIASADGTEVILRGVVVSSLVNQTGFYLQDETGIIAVVGTTEEVALLSSGDEVVIKGTKSHKVKDGYTGAGQINVYNAEVLVNYYGNHKYSTDSFITGKTVEDLYALNHLEDHSTEVYIVDGIVEVVETAYYTSIKFTSLDGQTKLTLYSSSANQYSFLKAYAGQTVTVEIAPCNWNSKTYYAACVLAVYDGETKVINTLNFNE